LLVFLGTFAALVLLYVGGLIVLHDQLSVASAIALSTALISLYWPIESWLANRRILRRGRESAVILFKFLSRPGEVGQVVGAEFLPAMGRHIEFDNVTLREPGTNRLLLQDVSLTIQHGQRVALVGPDDLEKHALVYLIPRFLDPSSGEIRIDQHNLRWGDARLAARPDRRGVAAQTWSFTTRWPTTSAAATRRTRCRRSSRRPRSLTPTTSFRSCRRATNTHRRAGAFPERQRAIRIALARAILRDPALFIIEEPATGLDEDMKALLDDTLTRVLPGRTAIFLPAPALHHQVVRPGVPSTPRATRSRRRAPRPAGQESALPSSDLHGVQRNGGTGGLAFGRHFLTFAESACCGG